MGQDLSSVAQAVQSQITRPSMANPISPSGVYFAYLDKADQYLQGDWSLMFDMIPAELGLPGLAGDTGDRMPPPPMPTIIFQPVTAAAKAVAATLPLDPQGEPAEGSWYVLYLEQGGDDGKQVVGELFHPDTDFDPSAPNYGAWHIVAADLLALPRPSDPQTMLGPPASGSSCGTQVDVPRTYGPVRGTSYGKVARYHPYKPMVRLVPRPRRRAPPPLLLVLPPLPPPLPPPPGYAALGVMAIGQGGFNLVFNRGTLEPAFYYDTGYPLGFFLNSVPANMRVGNMAFLGPILQNAALNLRVILSHWDWDHWRFGAFAVGMQSLGQLNWLVPVQPMSPTAAIFLAAGVAAVAVPVGAPPVPGPNGLIICKLNPGMAPHAFLVNNSGLAVRLPVDLAIQQSAGVLLTADANFNFVPGPMQAGLHVIGAVHHGSNNHGAAANLPAAPVATTGRIAYSYGVNQVTGNHPYGFPQAPAIAAYQLANWTFPTEMSTAEGPGLNAAGVGAIGNVRIGNQGALPVAYGGTAFAAIGYALP